MQISIEPGQFGWDYLIEASDGRNILVQSSHDYPGLAENYGWTAKDGTNYADQIADAQEFLEEHLGEPIEDPGYFHQGKEGK